MITFNVSAKVVDEAGDTCWTHITIQPSDDPGDDWLDISLADTDVNLPSGGNLMFDDPAELLHALELAIAERKLFMEGESHDS